MTDTRRGMFDLGLMRFVGKKSHCKCVIQLYDGRWLQLYRCRYGGRRYPYYSPWRVYLVSDLK